MDAEQPFDEFAQKPEDVIHSVPSIEHLLYVNDPAYALPADTTPINPTFFHIERNRLIALLEDNIEALQANRPHVDTSPQVAAVSQSHLEQRLGLLEWVNHCGINVWMGAFPAPEYPNQYRPDDHTLDAIMLERKVGKLEIPDSEEEEPKEPWQS